MSEEDALSKFDFSKVTGGGMFVKFEPGRSLVLRVLTVDPVVKNESYEDKRTGETVLSTKFNFVVYNWTDEKAQIWSATANTAKQIGALHKDEDFGADIRKIDVKITAPEKGQIKAYDIQVLPTAKALLNDQIKECAAIKLEEKVEGGQRMSFYDPAKVKRTEAGRALQAEYEDTETSGYDKAKAVAEDIKNGASAAFDDEEDVDLNSIPF